MKVSGVRSYNKVRTCDESGASLGGQSTGLRPACVEVPGFDSPIRGGRKVSRAAALTSSARKAGLMCSPLDKVAYGERSSALRT